MRSPPSTAGTCRREIQESACQYQKSVEAGDTVIVGVNRYVSEEKDICDILRVDQEAAARQLAGIFEVHGRNATSPP